MRLRVVIPLASALAAILVLSLLPGTAVAGELIDSDAYGPEIEAYPEYERQQRCQPRDDRPGVTGFRDLVLERYPGTRDGGIVRACHLGGPSLHKEGRAWDWMLDAGDPDEQAMADEVLEWLLETDEHGNRHAMARRLGVIYIIWDRRIWSTASPGSWQPYRGASPHTDHVHIAFSDAGADAKTSYWAPPEDTEELPTWFREFLATFGVGS